MRFVSFLHRDAAPRPGVWLEGCGILDIQALLEDGNPGIDGSSVLSLLRAGPTALRIVRERAGNSGDNDRHMLSAAAVTLAAPIPQLLRNAFCVGRNYHEHIQEGHRARGTTVKLPVVPQFFTKATHTINAPNGDIRLDQTVTALLDYEVELAVVMGRGGRDIAAESAFDHVFGYTVANDITARDLQRSHEQWFKGKSLDGTLPLGPWIVDREEIGDPTTLELSLDINGEPRQSAKVSSMIFDIPTIIASLSKGMTLEAGDIICTGTPSGVGYAMQPPRALKPGDLVTCRIDRIGTLANRIVSAA